ncbi:type II secretion system major pseudopilin GspG [Glaciecola sp. 2405UD65-10]|uniref:type II secretion system major pseudopilin GspG n=1 Tax=Glaciecola sp. 2405UD65-10 TaxID=3397244 RepID=UPI003B592A03
MSKVMNRNKNAISKAQEQGFTLIEIMVVLFIIGIMAAVVAPQILGNRDVAQVKKAAVDIQQLEGAMERYNLHTNTYPTTEQGLEALVSAPTIDPIPRRYPAEGIIKRLPLDPWGNEYVLLNPGELGTYDLYSAGPDGLQGTEDDIGNWNINDYLQ